ncbi:MAG: phosphoribosylformylglycinamidine cyclo-ligase [Solirubrobacteraceae bacterium]|jgi:phosphoribosylformylglycinamidine cyclo-ligase|nr:phosphoribosylformylglycinamidine cyclo-ligase [Solirubrobacteraceae bacterium]
MTSPDRGESAYTKAGVDYDVLDEGKRQALRAAGATSHLLAGHDGEAVDASRGEPAFVFRHGETTYASVLEGLGTKSVIARLVQEESSQNFFDNVAYDTVAAIVNDLCCVGAMPLVIHAYFATGSADWYAQAGRQEALVKGWRQACEDAGAVWGGGESPSLPELVNPADIELAGSAMGVVHAAEPILGQSLVEGDEIVFIASQGLHANGSSLARLVAKQLGESPYSTILPSGRTFGEALLDPAPMYSPLVRRLIENDIPLHYLSHITGHGMLKLMRPNKAFTYEITKLPAVPEILRFLVDRAQMPDAAAYSTFNMGCGFAVYCAAGSGDEVVALAADMGFSAHIAGRVKSGPRRVELPEIGVTYETAAMDLTPRRAA